MNLRSRGRPHKTLRSHCFRFRWNQHQQRIFPLAKSIEHGSRGRGFEPRIVSHQPGGVQGLSPTGRGGLALEPLGGFLRQQFDSLWLQRSRPLPAPWVRTGEDGAFTQQRKDPLLPRRDFPRRSDDPEEWRSWGRSLVTSQSTNPPQNRFPFNYTIFNQLSQFTQCKHTHIHKHYK